MAAASPPGKRRRVGEVDDDDAAVAAASRAAACARAPDFAAPAGASVLLAVGDEPPWHPRFTHQQFGGERVFGYAAPRIRIRYSDPDLRVHVACTAERRLPPGGERGGAAADELAACLRSSLPDGYPAGALRVATARDGDAGPAPAPGDFYPPAAAAAPEWAPPGPAVATYRLESGATFSVHRWRLDSPDARGYHDRMSTLAMWLIETASPVDCDDDAWTVYALYEEADGAGAGAGAATASAAGGGGAPPPPPAARRRRRFAGYATTYRFITPFRQPRPASLRLAQLLVLPRFQRQGHGGRLLEAVYADAAAAGGGAPPPAPPDGGYLAWGGGAAAAWQGVDAHEVTVEAPCEGMSRLRDAHDVARALRTRAFDALGAEWRAHQWAAAPARGGRPLPLRDVPAGAMEPARAALRCTLAQAYRAHEALLLASLLAAQPPSAPPPAPGDDAWKPFRLHVKRRLLATDADLRALGGGGGGGGDADADARKALLEDGYQACWAHYLAALAAAGLAPRALAASAAAAFAERERARELQLEAQLAAAAEGGAEGAAS